MENWFKLSLLLSVFGFLKEIRPSEPFIYEFLIGEWRNITAEQVNQEVYPVGTYSYLAQAILVFLITDLCRYKPLIVLLGVSGIIVWSMLLWTTSLVELQILEVFYGTFCATEVAYYTYIYAKVSKEYYQQVTSHTRAAILAGRAVSGIVAQLLVSFNVMDYRQLNYITFSAMLAATLWSLLLPGVKRSIYFHQDNLQKAAIRTKTISAFSLMFNHLKASYSRRHVLKWSLWWALSTCGFIQVQTYMQPLWAAIGTESASTQSIYNGAVESALTVLGFLGVLLGGVLKIDWKTKGELTLAIVSLLQGFVMLFSSQTTYVWVSYVCYIAFGALFHLMITVASSEIAKYIDEDSYGLIFGINTFFALVCQSILTAVVVTKGVGFGLEPRSQYFVYGIYHVIIAVLCICVGLTGWVMSRKDYRKTSVVAESNGSTNGIISPHIR